MQEHHMEYRNIRFVLAAFALVSLIGLGAPAQAQSYPQRHITLVAATAAGGPGDVAARIIAEQLSAALGQQVVVENVPGGGGITGAVRVARADPDGYTLLIHQTGITIAPALYPKLPFDLEKDLVPVGLVNTSYMFLVGRNSLPANGLKELFDWMNGPGKPVRFAHPGVGSIGHLATVMVAKSAKAEISPVPYRGIGPATNDVIGEHVDLLWMGAVSGAPLIKSGKVKAFAFGGPKRSPLAPDVPSIAELGYAEIDAPLWHALFAPAGTPQPVIQKINEALQKIVANPNVEKVFIETGVEAFPQGQRSSDAAGTFVKNERDRWRKVIEENRITPEQ
jgi:tripartite-type tricarboxylate transporter receptor subunit TctC